MERPSPCSHVSHENSADGMGVSKRYAVGMVPMVARGAMVASQEGSPQMRPRGAASSRPAQALDPAGCPASRPIRASGPLRIKPNRFFVTVPPLSPVRA